MNPLFRLSTAAPDPSIALAARRHSSRWLRVCIVVLGALRSSDSAFGADVTGFSFIKGEFLLQESPSTLTQDPLFGFSALGGVDLADFNLLASASIRLPEGRSVPLEDLGDSWSLLESFETQAALDAAYQWGDYTITFDSKTEGSRSCLVELPETPLPPAPRLVNFDDVRMVDPNRALTLRWEFGGATARNDFVQIYINLGHSEVYSTPGPDSPGALALADRSLTIPAGTLVPGFIHSLNLEITRITGTNAECNAEARGYAGVFRSTEIDLAVFTPPVLALVGSRLPGPSEIEVVSDPDGTVVLQASQDLKAWSNVATNVSDTGTNLFKIRPDSDGTRFFRAVVLADSPAAPALARKAPSLRRAADPRKPAEVRRALRMESRP